MTVRVFTRGRDFARAAQAQPGGAAVMRVSLPAQSKALDERTVSFVLSTGAVDRTGDTIATDGWRLDAYRKNPVVLWAHDATSLPLAQATAVWVERGALRAVARFTPEGLLRFNDSVFELLRGGFLRAVSVGFLPLKWKLSADPSRRAGVDFLEQELLEFSVVPVPANPESLVVSTRSEARRRAAARRAREVAIARARLAP